MKIQRDVKKNYKAILTNFWTLMHNSIKFISYIYLYNFKI